MYIDEMAGEKIYFYIMIINQMFYFDDGINNSLELLTSSFIFYIGDSIT